MPDATPPPSASPQSPSSNGASANGSSPQASGEKLRLGGMALRNGLLVHGPTCWAVAARNGSTGEIDVASGKKPNFGGNRVAKTPLLRGPVRLAEAFAVIPIARRAVPASRLPFEDPGVIATGVATSIASNFVRGKSPSPVREGIAATLGLAPALVSLGGSELAAYHASEHKAIGGYEQDADPETVPKEHLRCGSNLIVPMLAFSVLGQLVIERLYEKPGRVARGISGVAGISLSVEVFAYAERNHDSAVGRLVHGAGDWIQRLFATREPTPDQLAVGVAALEALLAAERG